MTATLQIEVDDPAAVLRDFTSVRVYRSATQDGAYAEVTTPETRLGLLAGQQTYAFTDPAGDADSWYATTYYNAETRQQSSRSPPVQASSGEPWAQLVDIAQLKQDYLFGLRLADLDGNPLPDSVFRTGVRVAVQRLQRRLGLQLSPVEVVDEHHDVRLSTAAVLPLGYLKIVPVRQIRALRLRWAPLQQNDPLLLDPQNVELKPFEGRMELRGYQGGWMAAPQTWQGGPGRLQAQTAMYGSFRGVGALRVDYAAGFAPGELPGDIKDLLCKAACLHPLSIAGDLAGPIGISSSSISFDGLGQSTGRTASQQGNAYASRMNDYNKQIDEEIDRLRKTYRSMQLRVI